MKKICVTCLFFCIFFVFSSPKTVFAQESTNVTVVYSDSDGEENTQVKVLETLLGEYPVHPSFVQDEKLTQSDLDDCQKLIYFGIDNATLSDATKEQINSFQGDVYGIGKNVSQLSRFSWIHSIGETVIDTATLKDSDYTLNEQRIIENIAPKDAEILQTVSNSKNTDKKFPLIAKKDNDFYLASEVLAKPFDWFLSDSFADFLDEPLQKSVKYLRLEDVHPKVDPKVLREQAEYLKEKNIPYMVAVIPIYTDGDGETTHLSDSPELVKTLRYMQDNGASIVLHGYRHQYRASETGEGFEFWDVENDRPILQPSSEKAKVQSDFSSEESYQKFYDQGLTFEKKYTESAIQNGVEELVANGLYPLAFEAPHYAISEGGYDVLSNHFSSYVGQLQLSNDTWESQYQPPYATKPAFLNGMTVYPETLGYVDQNDPDALTTIQEEVDDYANFDQVYLSAFYHPYLGTEKLKELVPILESSDATWFDLKQEANSVTVDDIEITSKNGEVTVDKPFISSTYERDLKFKKFLPYIVVGILIVFILGIIIL